MSKKYGMCNVHPDDKPHSLFQEKFKTPLEIQRGKFLEHFCNVQNVNMIKDQ